MAGPRNAIELFGVTGHYVGVGPIEDDSERAGELRWNVAFSLPIKRLGRHGNFLDALWLEMLWENSALARRFVGARRIGPWLSSPLPRFAVAGSWPEGITPLGNAAGALEPIGGEGMGLAMKSAQLAARKLCESIVHHESLDARGLAREFRKLWSIRSAACRTIGWMLGSPSLASPIIELVRNNNRLMGGVLALMGKQ